MHNLYRANREISLTKLIKLKREKQEEEDVQNKGICNKSAYIHEISLVMGAGDGGDALEEEAELLG